MFDSYRPLRPTACPACGHPLRGWQGKDGPCALLVFAEGRPGAIEQQVDDDIAMAVSELIAVRLPDDFLIRSHDCPRHRVDLRCRAENGTWIDSRVEWTAPRDPREGWREAQIVLGREPSATVRCPECGASPLAVHDIDVPDRKSLRVLLCPSCRARHAVER